MCGWAVLAAARNNSESSTLIRCSSGHGCLCTLPYSASAEVATPPISTMQYKYHHVYAGHIFQIKILSAAHTVFFVPQYTSVLPAVVEACVAVTEDGERGRLKGAQVLEVLHERSNFGAPDVGNIWQAALSPESVLSI